MKEMLEKQKGLPVELLAELIEYDPLTGVLTWLERKPKHFPKTCRQEAKCKSWNAAWAGKRALCRINSYGYFVGEIFSRPFRAHRVAWALYHGDWPGLFIDHINGDRQDNRIANLRTADASQNSKNTSAWGSSKYLGVSRIAKNGRFCVKINNNGRSISLGNFEREDVAAYVYDIFAEQFHKEFANLNGVSPRVSACELEAIKNRADQLGLTFKG